jgi:Tol biopolymer transport system component
LLIGAFAQTHSLAGAPTGRILYNHTDPATGDRLIFTMRPDGTDKRQVIAGPLDTPHWMPDGTTIVGTRSGPNGEDDRPATLVDVRTGAIRQLINPDPTLFIACPVPAADGARLYCEGQGDGGRTGVWSIRSSDGGDPRQLTATDGDYPGEPSPDGLRTLFARFDGDTPGTFIVNLDGTGLHQLILPPDLVVNPENTGSWSPDGQTILFEARATPDSRFSIWSIHPDGSGLRELVGAPLCGGLRTDRQSAGCHWPMWSPDGTRFVFSRTKNPLTSTNLDDIFVAHANGSGLQRLTTSPENEAFPDWGVAP